MGRSRAVTQSADHDHDSTLNRSKRKRSSSSGVDNNNNNNLNNLEGAVSIGLTGDGVVGGGKKALYHCNYCNKDISGKIRIKCAVCPDFDLCIECFSVAAEVFPHKSHHPYRVMDNLSFPLFSPLWNADEEILLIEGIEMYGLGNWTEVAEHVATKTKSSCINHYYQYYINSPCFPLPDMSHVMGKNREELLAMAKELAQVKKGETANEDPSLSATVKIEDQLKEGSAARSLSGLSSEIGASLGVNGNTSTGAVLSPSQNKDGFERNKVEDRSVGEKKPRATGEDGPLVTELSGYNFKRQEFEVEYDNDAEQLLADMEFKETDTEAEREIKLRVLRIYSKRLDERKRRKDFILERGLLYPDPFEMSLSPEEKEICKRYRVFMRLHSKEEHQELLKVLIEEHRIMKRIQDLQEARAAGCRTSAQAERYIEHKRKREDDEKARRVRDSAQAAPNGKFLQRASHLKGETESSPRGNARGPALSDHLGKDSSSSGGPAIISSFDNWDVDGFPGADLLSEIEKRLCSEIRILPAHYLNIMQTISVGMLKGTITGKTDAHSQFTGVDPSKVDRVYDMVVKKGFGQSYTPS